MKKMIVILAVFVVLLGAMIGEMIYVNNFYSGYQTELEALAENIEAHKDNVKNLDTIAMCESVADKWESEKSKLLLLQNHNNVRNFDDKILSLVAVIKSDNYNDAVIFISSAINYIDDVLLDSIPYLSNIL